MSNLSFIRKKLRDLPIPRKISLIIGLFSVVVIVLLSLSYFSMEILSGARAYVGGEGLWSKSEKQAVYQLTRYALSRRPSDYEKYLEHIAIPLGDRRARLEMSKSRMNMTEVQDGFVQGRNHPHDVRVMTLMARQLHDFPYMRDALYIWGEADNVLAELQKTADALHREIASPHPSSRHIAQLTDRIAEFDAQLTPLEDDFSYTLGAGARWIKGLVLAIMVLTTGLCLAVTLIFAILVSRHLAHEINHLRTSAARIAAGDYSQPLAIESKDEIGDLAQSFQRMVEQRQQAERLKDEFFANVSHELRTPLTLILSPLESLLSGDQGALNVRVETLLKTMHNNTVRLLQLVNGLLDFAKLNAEKLHVEREPVRIADLTGMLHADFQPLIQQKKIQSTVTVMPPEATVMMDRYFYERIVFNLLSNAVKFTETGGQIHIQVACADDRVTLKVSDTGVGIPAHELQNLFQRFRQVEGSSTRRFEGTGIGLALVKELAGLLEGTVSVQSQVGQGSVFTVTCLAPSAQNVALVSDLGRSTWRMPTQQYRPLPATPETDAPLGGRFPKVLIAEDNPEMAAYIRQLLALFCHVKIAADGEIALHIVREWAPDLLLTDIMMPKRDGLSLCREMKTTPALSHIPIIMLTALTHREALLQGWKAGADEYLYKPFHPKELITRVQSMLKATQNQKRSQEKILQLNEHLQQQAMHLRSSNQELADFTYSVSHDLRTPLRAIEGFTKSLLAPESALDPRCKADLERIATAIDQMEHLIDDLLKLSYVPKSELKLTTVDLSGRVSEITHKLQEAAPDRTVECVIAPQLRAQADSSLLGIALENLLQNAWKFTRKTAHPKIEFGVFERAGKKAFFIRDNGVGFNPVYTDQLFKPFSRLHKPSEFPGTGLGLALVERIIRKQGGQVWVEAQEDQGATFYFTLAA